MGTDLGNVCFSAEAVGGIDVHQGGQPMIFCAALTAL